jgi:phosphoribosyl 1,2-cyclic phosphate phosphodiesterase
LRLQLITCGIGRIDAVIYTHAHADHVAGLDEVRILNRIIGAPMPAYGSAALWEELQYRFSYAFRPWLGGFFSHPVLMPHIATPGETFAILDSFCTPLEQDHGPTPSLGLRFGKFAYCTDVVRLDDAALAILQGVELFIVDCFTPARDHPTHAGLPTVLAWVERLRPKRTVLTHLGPEMDYRTLCATLPAGIEPGYDGMVLEI